MTERSTSDVPAIPDPDFEWKSPGFKKDIFERALEENVEIPDNLRAMFERMAADRERKTPIEYDFYVESLFDAYEAQSYIDTFAVYDDDGRLNLDLTSERIGIPYTMGMHDETLFAHGQIVGLNGDANKEEIRIHLNPEQNFHQVTFGHEVGHFFWKEIMGFNDGLRTEENFCEYFGRRMALPPRYLEEYDQIDEEALLKIMSTFRMELSEAVYGLMEVGKLPNRISIDSYTGNCPNEDIRNKVTRGTFCLHCSQVGGDYNCPDANQPTPLFDFTDRSWGEKLSSCLGEDLHKADIMSTLTKFYVANEVQLVLFRVGSIFDEEKYRKE